MQLLVSVRGPVEARAALIGGADVIDAKDPRSGALGAVRPPLLAAIQRTVGSARPSRPVSAALGDAEEEPAVIRRARAASRRRVAFVKLGFAGVRSDTRAWWLAAAVVRHLAPATRLVLVAYADWERVGGLSPRRLVAIAAEVGAGGVLLDTAHKTAPLFALEAPAAVAAWVATVHAAGLFAALAGSLTDPDIVTAGELGADVVGVRGAACIGGRLGRVSPERVATLVALTRAAPGVPAGAPAPAFALS